MKTIGRSLAGATLMAVLILTIAASAPQNGKESPTARKPFGATRVGYVDVDVVSAKSRMIQDLNSKLQEKIDEMAVGVDKKKDELNKIVEDLKIKETVLTEDEISRMKKEAMRLDSDIKEKEYEIQEYFETTTKKVFKPAGDNLEETIRIIAREEGYDIILKPNTFLYANPALDISELVSKRLNDTYKPATSTNPSSKKAPSISNE